MDDPGTKEALAARLLARRGGGAGPGPAGPGPDFVACTPTVHPSGRRPPLFAIPGLFGGGLGWLQFGKTLSPDQPLVVLQPPSDDWAAHGLTTVEAMAAHLVARIRRIAPGGPYRLIGTSTGGYLAHRAACLLEADGATVDGLLMVDTDLFDDPGQLPDSVVELSPAELAANPLQRQGQAGARVLLRALRGHRPPGRCRAPIDYLWSSHPGRPPDRDRRLGWGEYTAGGLRILPAPQSHQKLVAAANFPLFARVVEAWGLGQAPPGARGPDGLAGLFPARRLETSFLGGGWVLGPDGARVRVARGRGAAGHVDRLLVRPGELEVAGWAAEPGGDQPAREVLFFLGGSYAGRALPDGARPDVVAATGRAGLAHAGFLGVVELKPGETSRTAPLHAVAVGGGGLALLAARSLPGW